ISCIYGWLWTHSIVEDGHEFPIFRPEPKCWNYSGWLFQLSLEVPFPLMYFMTVTPLERDQDCSLKNRDPDVPAPLVPGFWRLEQDHRGLSSIVASRMHTAAPFHTLSQQLLSGQRSFHTPYIYLGLDGKAHNQNIPLLEHWISHHKLHSSRRKYSKNSSEMDLVCILQAVSAMKFTLSTAFIMSQKVPWGAEKFEV
ncbi:hypothetical protein STEG23_029603, partial [Scotinomys teguina]